jgi:uncharacterized protein YacL
MKGYKYTGTVLLIIPISLIIGLLLAIFINALVKYGVYAEYHVLISVIFGICGAIMAFLFSVRSIGIK